MRTPSSPLATTLVEVALLSEQGTVVFRTNLSTDANGRIPVQLGPQLAQGPALAAAIQGATSVKVQQPDGASCTASLGHRS